jgi:hypothetical protein
MPAASPGLLPALLLPFLAWRVYRRFHRNVGRQPLRRGRLLTGIVVFAAISLLLLAVTFSAPRLMGSLGGGLAAGVGLAFVGLRLTRFEIGEDRHFYTPNTYIGVALTLMLAGRILYRFSVLYFSGPAVPAGAPAFMQSALTLAMIGLTAGYYIAYNFGVIRKAEGGQGGARR